MSDYLAYGEQRPGPYIRRFRGRTVPRHYMSGVHVYPGSVTHPGGWVRPFGYYDSPVRGRVVHGRSPLFTTHMMRTRHENKYRSAGDWAYYRATGKRTGMLARRLNRTGDGSLFRARPDLPVYGPENDPRPIGRRGVNDFLAMWNNNPLYNTP